MPQDSNIFLSLGKPVKDEYGRLIGEVTSFAVKPHGVVEHVYIRRNDGNFIKYPVGNIKFNGSEVVYLSDIKTETAIFCDQIPLIWRKSQALKELYEKKKISPEVYEDLHSSFEGALNQLKTEAQALLERINKEIERCVKEIRELNYALVHLEVEHEIGEVDNTSYQMAFSTIQECLKRANMEKADLEGLRSKLSNILLGETIPRPFGKETVEVPSPMAPTLPEPPVIVYVKEAGGSSV
ncbi:MAG: CdvA-like protein [Candidatus Bathyarchaeota archaeon]|nr:CdvA-like protein [Candidatus Bathyarchaeota archaeon]MDW8041050.1 CdvA-like protein [Nitrososphaerota archaeon]